MKHTDGKIEARTYPSGEISLHWVHSYGHTELASVEAATEVHDDLANAERLAACWNAMKGIENPAAFMEKVREAVEAKSPRQTFYILDQLSAMLPKA